MAVGTQERPPFADSAIELLPDEPRSAAAARRLLRTALRGRERGGPVEATIGRLTNQVERTRAAVSTTLTARHIARDPGAPGAAAPPRRCAPRGMRERG
ncbi:hypothetical protein [Streptomyces sp. CB03911]|uniref:hypothetical protein n=1 Tax=Streptomyces sp. CB03911 TaxID=1804758 RepID=UPI0018FEECC3|nr:hypothetical protein [Streptomyces sp. CB03911]